MNTVKGVYLALAVATAVAASVFILGACGEVIDGERPQVGYLDQTFSVLVCDGNGNDPAGWDHDGAAVCTLDWNGDGAGPNHVPVTYVYNDYPVVDGIAENLGGNVQKGGDYWLWEKTPWATITTSPMMGNGSGVTKVEAKALFTYYKTPRIWFFFRWEDPSHTIQPPKTSGNDPNPVGGTMQYYWCQKGGYEPPAEGFLYSRAWASHEDWLALVWSTWFAWNTRDKGKEDKGVHRPADFDGRDWRFVETVPGFQEKGAAVCRGTGDVAYKTPAVTSDDPDSPYYDKYYPGPYCDMWFFSATRTNYCGEGWDGSAWLFDCYIDQDGFAKPPVGANNNPNSLDENFDFDSGTPGYEPNGGVTGYPAYQSPYDPGYNPPGAYYLWKDIAEPFNPGIWGTNGEGRIPGYLHRRPYGSAADVIGRCQWQQPGRKYYAPWEGAHGERLRENEYGKDWCYTLEIEREIGTYGQTDPTEDVFLGIYEPH
jgi:hypothetical protein